MALVSALDQHTPKGIGEKANVEYNWSNDYKEKFSQFFFQLVRTTDTNVLENQLNKLIVHFKQQHPIYKEHINDMYLLVNLYKMISQTRDIVCGKGEYNLTFAQIWVWYQHFPELAKYAFEKCVIWDDTGSGFSTHPYGSWKDIKYFAHFIKERIEGEEHPLIDYACDLMVKQLKADKATLCEFHKQSSQQSSQQSCMISLAGKWCPREKSKFGWLYKKIATSYSKGFFETVTTKQQYVSAVRKSNMVLRKVLSRLNKHLKTTQIAQCANEWETIKFNNVTSITMRKNKLAFQNKTKQGNERSDKFDRITCASNFTSHIELAKSGSSTAKVHGKRVGVYELVKDAINANEQSEQESKDVVNLQWDDNKTQNCALGNFIPMADTSGSMSCNNNIPLYNSIGLSIRVSEITAPEFRNRIMTFSAHPEWVNLEGCKTFCDKVERVSSCNWGMNTNFYAAMKMILDTIVENNMPPRDVENLVLAIFSDMQIDSALQYKTASNKTANNNTTMYQQIEQMYADAGMKSKYKTPYKSPHILFWNLRNTTGFPVLSSQNNVTMLSGYSPVLLNAFYNKGMDALKNYSPYMMINDILCNERYKPMERKMLKQLL